MGSYLKEAIYSDLMWNTAANLASVRVESEALFSRFVVQTRLESENWANLIAEEKSTDVKFTFDWQNSQNFIFEHEKYLQ